MSDTPIALQLWSVREECSRDLPGTLEALAQMGYEGVEFAGYYGYTAQELLDMLGDAGLKVAGSHLSIDHFLGDKLDETLAFERALGNCYLVVPALPEKYRGSVEAWRETARLFAEIAQKVEAAGMHFGYHNHRMEFEAVEGQIPWDVFAQNTPQGVILQLDVGHCLRAGGDPCAYLRKYAGRYASIHVRDWAESDPDAIVGEGAVPWEDVFAIVKEAGATAWYTVEQTAGERPELECVALCLENLEKMQI